MGMEMIQREKKREREGGKKKSANQSIIIGQLLITGSNDIQFQINSTVKPIDINQKYARASVCNRFMQL